MPAGEPTPSAQEQLDLLAADRERVRTVARYPFWYWALWSVATTWWGLIMTVPDAYRPWIGFGGLLLFIPLFVYRSRRGVKVPNAPLAWPSRREWVVMGPTVALYAVCFYLAFRLHQVWLITVGAVIFGVVIAVFSYREQRIVFRDER